MRKVFKVLGDLIHPAGPLGEVLSPSDVFKTRLGLPTQSPHVTRAKMEAPAHVEHVLAVPRFVAVGDVHDVPANRVREIGPYIEEVWSPVYRRTESIDHVEILLASREQVGWTVTQRESQASRSARRSRINAEEFEQVLLTAQIQASDDIYNGYFETIPGNDPCVIDGEILRGQPTYERNADGSRGKMIHDGIVRGGTMIRGGRREYREKTKGMVHWDAGFLAERAKAQKEMESRPVRNVKANLEAMAGQVLPMHRTLLNPRVDRKSAV